MKINKYNEDFFKVIDSELKAYILGYIVADGCITIENRKSRPNSPIKRVQFQPSIDDYQVIKLIRDVVAPNNKITLVKSKKENHKDTIKLRLANKNIVEDLMDLHKIFPRKTLDRNFKFPTMEKSVERHFIRGFIDGDGSFGKQHFSMICSSKYFADDILKRFLENIPDLKHYLYKENRKYIDYYSLHFSINKKSRIDLFEYLYKDCTFKLNRKFYKILNTVLNKGYKRPLSV